MRAKARILLVQNAQTQGNGTKRHLEGAGYTVVWAGSGVSALAAAKQQTVDLILIDVALPDIEGGDLCRRFRSRDTTRAVPIILLTSRGQVPSLSKGANGGPDDYLSKPYAEGELDAKVAAALNSRGATAPQAAAPPVKASPPRPPAIVPVRGVEPRPDSGPFGGPPPRTIQEQRLQEPPRNVERAASPLPPRTAPEQRPQESPGIIERALLPRAIPEERPQGPPGKVGRAASPQPLPPPDLKHVAPAFGAADNEVIDPATGLFGKKQFEAMFSKEFKRSVRFKQQMSCMLIDLDGRNIGREGDAATLRAIIGLVQHTIREVDTAAWWSGEALNVLLPNTIRNDAVQAAARVLESVATHPFSWSDSSKVTMSIGVAGMPDRKIDSEQKLIDAAAAACRRAQDLMLPLSREERKDER